MTQAELNDAVSQATGEEINAIRQRGFSLIDLSDLDFDPECDSSDPQVIDFDARFSGTTQSFFDLL